MVSRIVQVTLDVRDLELMARFWSSALGYRIERAADGVVRLRPVDGDNGGPTIWLQPGVDEKTTKNRCHLDVVAPDAESEVERLLALGATRTDVGQTGAEAFEVLADPEGNEFCVLHHWSGSG